MKSFLKGVLFSTIVAVALFVTVNAAQANTSKAVANGAIVTKLDNGCTIFDVSIGLVFGHLQDVQTPSGNEKFTCNADIPAGLEPDHAIVIDGTCGGFTGTGTANIRLTPGGQALATCQIKK